MYLLQRTVSDLTNKTPYQVSSTALSGLLAVPERSLEPLLNDMRMPVNPASA
jgi:hypothetical protein